MDSTTDQIKVGRSHLKELSDDEFTSTYSSSKHRYQATAKSYEWLQILKESLEEREDLDIDPDMISNIYVTISYLKDLIDRMHSASYWAAESQNNEDD